MNQSQRGRENKMSTESKEQQERRKERREHARALAVL
jgi:hypothetical protein